MTNAEMLDKIMRKAGAKVGVVHNIRWLTGPPPEIVRREELADLYAEVRKGSGKE